ncbi:galactokinase [Xanthoria parietina]
MDEPVPVTQSIESLYPDADIPAQQKRWQNLIAQFEEKYHKKPAFVARSPGRVNLIGEHVDYSLYEVLPMAIAADVLIAVAVPDEKEDSAGDDAVMSMLNTNPRKHRASGCTVPPQGLADIDATQHEWTNYFKAGFNGAVGLLRKDNPMFSPRNLQILVDGNVPAGGGLSSSAAFVCASALAVLRANGKEPVKKKELVELAIVSERAVGVNSGGMDQSASVFSIKGDALSVSFSPILNAEAIPIPELEPSVTFMIAQSFVTSDKHVTAPRCYNLRVVECTLAAEMMARTLALELQDDSAPLGRSLRGLQHAYYSRGKSLDNPSVSPWDSSTPYKTQIETILSLVSKVLDKEDGYTRGEIASALSMSIPALEAKYMTKFPVDATRFMLGKRARHVFSEALRVIAFKELLQDPASNTDQLPRLGALMNETQESCRKVYECSCPEIEQLCTIARNAGAYGSRLTGAGWGGCTVHLVPRNKVDDVRNAWIEEYYRAREPEISEAKLQEAIVVSQPGQGSVVVEV